MADNVEITVRCRLFGRQLAIAVMRLALRFDWRISWPIFVRLKAGGASASWHVVMVKSGNDDDGGGGDPARAY